MVDGINRNSGINYEEVISPNKHEQDMAFDVKSDIVFDIKDEYISSEKSDVKPSGLYRMGQDQNGNPKIIFDDPRKTNTEKMPQIKNGEPESKAEDCTTNTDKVDREIEKLKEEKAKIEQQIKAASENPERQKELQSKLLQIEAELKQKDNDTYRRQNAVIQ